MSDWEGNLSAAEPDVCVRRSPGSASRTGPRESSRRSAALPASAEPEPGFASMIRTFPSLMDPPQVHPPISHDACRPARSNIMSLSLAHTHRSSAAAEEISIRNAHGKIFCALNNGVRLWGIPHAAFSETQMLTFVEMKSINAAGDFTCIARLNQKSGERKINNKSEHQLEFDSPAILVLTICSFIHEIIKKFKLEVLTI